MPAYVEDFRGAITQRMMCYWRPLLNNYYNPLIAQMAFCALSAHSP